MTTTPAATPATSARSPYADAGLYDVLFEGYRSDLEFYLGLARAAGGPVLDLCCGTGRVLLPMLAEGIDAEGADVARPMLEQLARNAAAERLDARTHEVDMRALALDRRFALIVIPFNAFVHALTSDDQIETLRRCHRHLEPGGRLTMDLMNPSLELLLDPDGTAILELEVPHPETGLPVRLYDTRTKDRVTQIQHSHIEIQELDPAGGVRIAHRSETTVRWIHANEVELLLGLAGFARWEILGGYDGEPLEDESYQMVVSAWRGEDA